MPLICCVKNCSKKRNTIQEFLDHLRNGHSIHFSGVEVRCGQESCPASFVSFRALKRHLQKHHSQLEKFVEYGSNEIACSGQSNVTAEESMQIDFEDSITARSSIGTESTNVDITSSCMSFLGQLQSKASVSLANVQVAAECMNVFLSDVTKYAHKYVEQLCHDTNVDITGAAAQKCSTSLSNLPDCLAPIETEYKRAKYLVTTGFLIEPQTIDLGHRTETRFSAKSGFNQVVVVPDNMQYVPIEKLLGTVLRDTNFRLVMANFTTSLKSNDSQVISHFFHTQTYKKHGFLQENADAFALHLFVDGFEVANPLGSHTSVHKMEGLYLVIQNFPAEIQSKLSSVFLVALWHAQDVKKYGYDRILEPVVNVLQKLETKEGVAVSINGAVVTVRAALVLFSADNLGFNSLFGFFESFTASKFCRFCECTRAEADATFVESKLKLRTKQTYDTAVNSTDDPAYDPRLTGIKRGCVLNNLKHFHVTDNLVVDAMHDILEGIAPFEVALILVELNNAKYLTVEDLNMVITFFNYSTADKNSRPPTLTALHSLKMSASEMWCFLRNLPLMIGNRVPRDNKYWNLLLMLLDIIDIVFAPRITNELSNFLMHLIDDHHSFFKELFPDKRLLPKHHFLVHYPRCLVASGPPVRYWCMRFEARHKFFKEVGKQTHCYINICKTLAKRFQLSLAYCFLNRTENALQKLYDEIGPVQDIVLCSMDDKLCNAICEALHTCSQDTVFDAKWIKIGHYYFKPGCVVLCSLVEGNPDFGVIKKIVELNNNVVFIVERLRTLYFDDHFHAYAVEHHDCVNFNCIELSSLKDHVPLQYHNVTFEKKNVLFVALRYTVF